VEVEETLLDVEFDDITVLDEGEGSAHGRLWRRVEDHRTVGRTAHPRIGDPHHVRHPYIYIYIFI
jgi:hypothetical protein